MGRHRLQQQTTPAIDPPAGYQELYFKADGKLYSLDENGVEREFGDSSSIPTHASTHENGGADEISVAGLNGVLADAQTPTSHASSHENGGADEISVAGLSGVLADAQPAAAHASSHENGGADEISVAGLSGELADAQPPKTHASSHENGGADEISVAGLSGELADAQPPKTHASSHENGGADEISVAGLSGVLADEQDAGSLKGDDLTFTSLRLGCKIYYDSVAGEWKNEPLPLVPYGKVLGTDWAPSWSELNAFGHAVFFNTSISATSHVGNATVATLNGLSPTAGDSYTVTDAGVLTAGSLPVGPGVIVYWTGSAWAYLAPAEGGYVTSGIRVQLSTTTALIAPYTDGTDDGKIVGFDGTDNTGTFTTADLTFTLPNPSGLPQDGMFRGPIYAGNFTGQNRLTIDIASSGTFSDGLSSLALDCDSENVMLGGVNGLVATTWMRISTICHHLQVRRASTWAASNFTSFTAIPFDTEDREGNPDVSYWDNPTNTTRFYAALKGRFSVTGFVCIDSTGGFGSWTLAYRIRKNGSTTVVGSELFTGNYSNEDQTITLPEIVVEMAVGDYIEVEIDQTSLTGNLRTAMLAMDREY